MFPIIFDVTITGHMTVRDRRKLQRFTKMAMRAALHHWHDRHFKFHFSQQAFFRYGDVYKRRRTRRRREPNKNVPNVRSGRMRRMLEQSFVVRGTVKNMRGEMRGPSYTDVSRPGHPDKAAEITHISPLERAELARVVEKTLADLLRTPTGRRTRRLRVAA